MTRTRTRGLWLPAALLALCTTTALARTGVLVLRDGMQSEYAFCREDEFGGWGERHPAVAMFRAGLLGHARRFERYLADSPGLSVQTLDLEAHEGRLPLAGVGLVILDEASSRLDPATEQLIERTVEKLLRNRTAIIVAHRLRTVQRADSIMILEEGQISEYGAREQLAADPESRFYNLLQTGLSEVLA